MDRIATQRQGKVRDQIMYLYSKDKLIIKEHCQWAIIIENKSPEIEVYSPTKYPRN